MLIEQLKTIDDLSDILDTFTIDEDKHFALTSNLNKCLSQPLWKSSLPEVFL